MSRTVVLVDAVRTPFGKAGGMYAGTRADDLMVRAIRGLLERNPKIDPASIEDVAIAAATQTGDQGMNIGRSAALLSGLPNTVPGYSIDRWCAGALTAVTTIAGAIAMGANEIAIAGGVEHMGNHPMGEGMDPNPRYLAERIVEQDALAMGATAERLHDRFPQLTKERADRYAMNSQLKTAQAYAEGKIQRDLIPTAARSAELGWTVATADEAPRPQTTMEGLAGLKTPFRPAGRVTPGNSSGLTLRLTGRCCFRQCFHHSFKGFRGCLACSHAGSCDLGHQVLSFFSLFRGYYLGRLNSWLLLFIFSLRGVVLLILTLIVLALVVLTVIVLSLRTVIVLNVLVL